MINLTVQSETLARAVKRAKEKNIIIPTLKQQRDPGLIPEGVVSRLKNIGLWDIDPLNLFRVHQTRDGLDKPRLVDLVWNLRDDKAVFARALVGFHGHFRPDYRLPAACPIGQFDAFRSADDAARREVRPLDELHQVVTLGLGVVDKMDYRVTDFREVVRGATGRHAYCNS